MNEISSGRLNEQNGLLHFLQKKAAEYRKALHNYAYSTIL